MSENKGPKNRYEIEIHISASDKQSILAVLRALHDHIDSLPNDEPPYLIGARNRGSFILKSDVDTSITEESYYRDLDAYVEQINQEGGGHEREQRATNIMFVGTQCPGCGHIWTEQDDLLWGARTRSSEPPEAWHDECIRKAHPELFEDVSENDN